MTEESVINWTQKKKIRTDKGGTKIQNQETLIRGLWKRASKSGKKAFAKWQSSVGGGEEEKWARRGYGLKRGKLV